MRLVGGGEEALMENCKALAHEIGVAERVEFLGGRTDVAQLLQEADVVVLSSHYEGLSLSSLEGMACGKPFVASDVEGLRDIVGGYGVLFPEGNEKELAQIIRRLCEDRNYARVVANRCVERAKLYDVHVTTQRYLALYEQMEHSCNK
ncbi:MAG: glycosyltransferase [Bacteroidaceae bacterium]|nr:glycosyltransferase [Bacteroidaceae bacterium]